VTLVAVGPTRKRLKLAARAAVLRNQGLLLREIAAELGVSYGYAHALVDDPDGAKARKRKDGYQGVCKRCGGPTTGSEGRGKVRHCRGCQLDIQRESKVWTREAVIDAIQRFAAAHGRPPKAGEWITADRVNGYPPRSAVYGNCTRGTGPPFARWADAIEAAGFIRPRPGKRQNDTGPIVARVVLAELRRHGEPFHFFDVGVLLTEHGGCDYRVAMKRAGGYLRWWLDHGYVVRFAYGRYVTTEKRYRDEQVAA
jgi:hypothetical protein